MAQLADAEQGYLVLTSAVSRLVARRRTSWVGIDGFGATGKTTLANRVAAAVRGTQVVHIDDFAHPDIPTWDRDRFLDEVVEPLSAGHAARYRVGGWQTRDLADGPLVEVAPGVPVIVEGVSSTDDRLGIAWAVRVWLEAPREIRLARAELRDGPNMVDTWVNDWMPSEEAYAAAQNPRARADLIIDASD